MFSVSQLSRVMICPTQGNLSFARQVIKYIIGSLDLKITYCPDEPNYPLSETNNELMTFTILIGLLLSIQGAVMDAM